MLPQSLVDICKDMPDTDHSAMTNAWRNYRTTKTVPTDKTEKLALGSILGLNRVDYTKVTGLKPLQSMYLTVHKIRSPSTVAEHIALREATGSPLELMLIYPSISLALYAETALALYVNNEDPRLNVSQYSDYIESIDRNLKYRQSTGLITSADEPTGSLFLDKAVEILGHENFSKRFFLQGKVLLTEAKQDTIYDIVDPLTCSNASAKTVPTVDNITTFGSATVGSATVGSTEQEQREENPLTAPIATLFSRSDVASRPEMDAVWRKLRTHKVRPTRSLMADMKAIANFIRDTLTDSEKLAAINIINQTRPHYLEIVGHTKLASPLYVLLRKPLEPITREEHIQLRELLLEEGGLTALYLLYPSLSIAIQAQAGLAVNWPQGGQDLAVKFKAYITHCGATYQNRLNVRLLKKNIDEPADALYSTMRALVPLTATRHVFQGAVLFCRSQCVSMYDLNNVITLKGECITEHGAELPENQNIKWKYKL